MKIKLFRIINYSPWLRSYAMPKVSDLKEIITKTIRYACGSGFEKVSFSATIVFVDGKEIQEYNKEYRNIDKSTDVLSFPEFDFSAMKWSDVITKGSGVCYLGDIMLGHDIVIKDAREMGWRASERVLHLVAHSVLHLLGFDHQEDDERIAMETLEKEIMSQMGLPNPYEQ